MFPFGSFLLRLGGDRRHRVDHGPHARRDPDLLRDRYAVRGGRGDRAVAFLLTASAKATASLAEALRAKAEAGSHTMRWSVASAFRRKASHRTRQAQQ